MTRAGPLKPAGSGARRPGILTPAGRRRGWGLLLAAFLLLAGCSGTTAAGREPAGSKSGQRPADQRPGDQRPGDAGAPAQAVPGTPDQPKLADGTLLSSSFEKQVCGKWFGERKPECEFGVEGGVEAGPFGSRTGAQAVRIDRTSPEHMGVVADLPLPGGTAFIGVAHRVPAIPDGAIPTKPGHIQLEQLSPTDGKLAGWPVEVRLYPDRRLGLGRFKDDEVVMSDWQVPVDQWFYVVVEVANGPAAIQRMWIYDAEDNLVDEVEASLKTQDDGAHANRTAQKVGGSTPTLAPMYTYADDWYVATTLQGARRISEG